MATIKCFAEKVNKKLESYKHIACVVDHIIEEPSQPSSVNYKAVPSPVLFENHTLHSITPESSIKSDSTSDNESNTSSVGDPHSDVRPILGLNNEGMTAVTDDSDTEDEKPEKECDIPMENYIITNEPVSPSQYSHPQANVHRKNQSVTSNEKKVEKNESVDKPIKVFYRMEGSDKIISDEEYPIKFANYSKIEKIWQESTIWFPKHERTNDIPP